FFGFLGLNLPLYAMMLNTFVIFNKYLAGNRPWQTIQIHPPTSQDPQRTLCSRMAQLRGNVTTGRARKIPTRLLSHLSIQWIATPQSMAGNHRRRLAMEQAR